MLHVVDQHFGRDLVPVHAPVNETRAVRAGGGRVAVVGRGGKAFEQVVPTHVVERLHTGSGLGGPGLLGTRGNQQPKGETEEEDSRHGLHRGNCRGERTAANGYTIQVSITRTTVTAASY